MLYTLEQGQYEEDLIRQFMREKRELPSKIQNAPRLLPWLSLYYSAFWRLSGSRQLGFGAAGEIPHEVVMTYADRYEFDGVQREALEYHIKVMDNAFLKAMAKQSERKSKAAQSERPKTRMR